MNLTNIIFILFALTSCSSSSDQATIASSDETGGTGTSGLPQLNECLSSRPDWIFCTGFEEINKQAQKDVWDDGDNDDPLVNNWIEDGGPFSFTDNLGAKAFPTLL